MTIAVHIPIQSTETGFHNSFLFNSFSKLAECFPNVQFIFIFNKAVNISMIRQPNVKTLLLLPEMKNRLLLHYWYNFKLPQLFKKYNVTHFINEENVCSVRTTVQQWMLIHELGFLDKGSTSGTGKRYIKKNFPQFISTAVQVFVTNPAIKETLFKKYNLPEEKVEYAGFGTLQTEMPAEKLLQQAKTQYTGGKEYFLAFITPGTVSNTLTLLKAFSLFKKRQLSNFQLILLSGTIAETMIPGFSSYKYRQEVIIVEPKDKQQLQQLIAAAYAAIFLPQTYYREEKGMMALNLEVPLLTSDIEEHKRLYGAAALYSTLEEGNIAANLMLLYKDENLRNSLRKAGKLLASDNSYDAAASKFAQSLQLTANETA